MKRKILITSVVLAAGFVSFLAFDSRAAEMVQDTMGVLDFHAKKFVTSTFSSLSTMQIGIILMIVALTVVAIFFRGGKEDKI
jgi:uncharacterized membrane protein